MAIELSEFWTRLVRAGVTDAAGCKVLALQYKQAHRGTPPANPATLAEYLIQSDRLTDFQSQALLAEMPTELRLGRFLIRSPQASPPWKAFASAERLNESPGSDSADGEMPDRLRGVLLRTVPDNPWILRHASVSGMGLQAYSVERFGEHDAVFSPLKPGSILLNRIDDHAWTVDQICKLGIQIASALALLHQAGLSHGAVRADRIWWEDAGGSDAAGAPSQSRCMLLRDPSMPFESSVHQAGNSARGGWLEVLDDPACYVAPEWSANMSQSTPQTDLYALGCLLFRMATGRFPVQGSDPADTLRRHSVDVPDELAVALNQGQAGNPLMRVLAYALAKTPQARFATADQMIQALRAVVASLPTTESPANSTRVPTNSTRADDPREPQPKPETAQKRVQKNQKRRAQEATPSSTAEITPARVADKSSAATESSAVTESTGVTSSESAKVDASSTTQSIAVEPSTEALAGDAVPPVRRRQRAKRPNKAVYVLATMAGIVVLQVIYLLLVDPVQPVVQRKRTPFIPPAVIPSVSGRSAESSNPNIGDGMKPLSQAGSVVSNDRAQVGADTEDDSPRYQLVDDERLLYAPPFVADSQPVSLDLLPPGPAMIASIRLSEVMASPAVGEMVQLFAPELSSLVENGIARVGVPVERIERLTAALHPGKAGRPEVSLSITLDAPMPLKDLLDRWKVSAARTKNGDTFYASDEPGQDAFYLPQDQIDQGQIVRFALGSIDQMSELALFAGEPIPLPRSMGTLWSGTSDQADFAVMSTSNFLFADGRSLLQDAVPQLAGPLRKFLIPATNAVMMMADLNERRVYAELRLAAAAEASDASLSRSIASVKESWGPWADDFVVSAAADPSWRLLSTRLPLMMRFVSDQVRVGIVDQTAVANIYLPAAVMPQLSLATVLALNTQVAAVDVMAADEGVPTLSVGQMLDRPMTVSFGQESLEFAIDAIVEAFTSKLPKGSTMPDVEIIGSDLQLMGITQNQQIRDFKRDDVPLRQVLTDLVVGANPDKSATGPNDPLQALVWVVVDDPDDASGSRILITTRQAAEGKYELPEEFRLP